MVILLASNNRHKQRELQEILSEWTVKLPSDFGIDFDYDETGDSFLVNALGKTHALRAAADTIQTIAARGAEPGVVIVADDSGLCVDALDGAPGIYSARFGSPDGGRTELPSEERNALLLEQLKGETNRSARFVCCMVALFNDNRFAVVQETFEGLIAHEPSGAGGFGYDPVFQLPGRGLTVADLTDAEKHMVSHRGKAARALGSVLSAMDG